MSRCNTHTPPHTQKFTTVTTTGTNLPCRARSRGCLPKITCPSEVGGGQCGHVRTLIYSKHGGSAVVAHPVTGAKIQVDFLWASELPMIQVRDACV